MNTWETPKQDWHPSNPEAVVGADYNRIEGNIAVLSFGSPIQDVEGNIYKTVVINGQQWTADNWACTKYADGVDIGEVTDQSTWEGLTVPAYCKYDNYVTQYGLLYNWYVGDPSNQFSIAPDGWRVPSLADIVALNTYLVDNGYRYDRTNTPVSVKTAKSWASINGWTDVDVGAPVVPGQSIERNNNSGVSIFPGGKRGDAFQDVENNGYVWTRDEGAGSNEPWSISVAYDASAVTIDTVLGKYQGMSIKLVRDI